MGKRIEESENRRTGCDLKIKALIDKIICRFIPSVLRLQDSQEIHDRYLWEIYDRYQWDIYDRYLWAFMTAIYVKEEVALKRRLLPGLKAVVWSLA